MRSPVWFRWKTLQRSDLGLKFRVFGHGVIKTVQERMWGVGALLGMARKMPMELYLVSAHTDSANVKVREGLLDIKIKVGETPEGYEIFQPRGKLRFPVGKANLTTVTRLKSH